MGQTEVFLFGGNVHIKPDEEERVDAADLRILTWGGCAPIGAGGGGAARIGFTEMDYAPVWRWVGVG